MNATVMDALPQVQPEFRDLPVYATEEGRGAFLRMDFNEGPSPDLSWLAAQLALSAFAATTYPDYGFLRRAAAEAWGVSPEAVMPVNGADEGIALLVRALGGRETSVLMPTPTFPMYRIYSQVCGVPVTGVPLAPDGSVDAAAMENAIPGAGVLALCSPNNPTGQAIPEATLARLLEAADGRPVILDETYAPFCGQDRVPWLVRYPNLLVLRTLSKAYGLPGLRCGFILADPRFLRSLEPLRSPFNVNGIAAALGAQVLQGDAGMRQRLARAVAARRQLQQALSLRGLESLDSDTHFFVLMAGEQAPELRAALRRKDILVKDLGAIWPGALRISVAEPDQVPRFLDALPSGGVR